MFRFRNYLFMLIAVDVCMYRKFEEKGLESAETGSGFETNLCELPQINGT